MPFVPRRKSLDRRTLLRGAGAVVALPFLDAMLPAFAFGGSPSPRPGSAARLACMYVPNGVHMPSWTPTAEGETFTLPTTLEALTPFKSHVRVLSGLALDAALAHGDGPGDHARACASFLTCEHPFKTGGAGVKVGVSFDQVAATKLGATTRLPSLELGCEAGRASGDCDSGYACAYVGNISWRTPTSPSGKETSARAAFTRLFGAGAATAGEREDRRGVLDAVREDAKRLHANLGGADREKLDEYLTGVREFERRLARDEKEAAGATAKDVPVVPKDYREHIRQMYDLTVLAFRADLTRVVTFMHANEGSNRSYADVGAPEGHHDLSHHGKDPEKRRKVALIDRFHLDEFARFIKSLSEAKDGDRTLLDRAFVVYGSGVSDGDRHNHDDLPVLLCGGGDGTLKPGGHVRSKPGTPLANLYVSLLDRLNVRVPAFADSTGRLEGV